MRLHRFITEYQQEGNKIVISNEKVIHQITRVFRLGADDRLIICDNNHTDFVCKIIEKNKLEILETKKIKEDIRKVIIGLAYLKKDAFEYALEKMTEAGVDEIFPVITEHTLQQNFKRERFEDILREATEQSGRGKIPTLYEPQKLETIVTDSWVVADFDGKNFNEVFHNNEETRKILIGPEGGWSDSEKALFYKHKIGKLSLGKSVLRAETASIIATWGAKNL